MIIGSKSHSEKELISAIKANEEIFFLNTGNDGHDDILIGSKKECQISIEDWLEADMPESWKLIKAKIRKTNGNYSLEYS